MKMSVGCTYLPDFLSPDDDSFGLLETDLEGVSGEFTTVTSSGGLQEVVGGRKRKRLKMCMVEDGIGGSEDGQQNVLHISVERNRRKQMNEHLNVLRSLMPCFYVKRGDQASIIEGVVDYITELQQILQSLEAKKQRKVYSEIVLRPMLDSSPRKPPFSPMPNMPISPRTPQPEISYRPMPAPFISPSLDTSPVNSFDNADNTNELMANSKSDVAEVEVKFIGGNLLLKTCSNRILGKATKIIAVLENLSLEVLQAKISVVDETRFNSFIIKIGVECQLSAEELAQHIQQTFC